MPTRNGDDIPHLTLAVLESIRGELGSLRQEFGGLREEFGGLREEFGGLRADVNARLRSLEDSTIRGFRGVRGELDKTNARLENLVEVAGGGWRDHETRLSSLERRVSRVERRRAPPPKRRERGPEPERDE